MYVSEAKNVNKDSPINQTVYEGHQYNLWATAIEIPTFLYFLWQGMDSKVQNTMNDFLMLSNNQFIENVSNAILIFPSVDVSIPTVLSLDQTDLETSLCRL